VKLASQLLGAWAAVIVVTACAPNKVAESEVVAEPPKFDSKQIEAAACLASVPKRANLKAASFVMGSDKAYREESPAKSATVGAFDIDTTEVTNDEFARFVTVTGYVTDAEKTQAGFNAAGGAVFTPPTATRPTWWQFVEGANWRAPSGPESSIEGRGLFPVVQVSHADAKAYAEWANRRLPTEAEWEYAAKAGSETLYVWGEDLAPNGQQNANTWQGAFPVSNTAADGYTLLAPVGCFLPNGFGLYDMIGNVWEWTDSTFDSAPTKDGAEAVYAIKGGSYLCAENYCRRYRASARQPQEAGFSTNHIGFRTVKNNAP